MGTFEVELQGRVYIFVSLAKMRLSGKSMTGIYGNIGGLGGYMYIHIYIHVDVQIKIPLMGVRHQYLFKML